MKNLIDIINEKLVLGKKQNKNGQSKIINKLEVINNADCLALPEEYMEALITAFAKSPLKRQLNAVKCETFNANYFFKEHEFGKSFFEENKINYTFLFNKEYPVLFIEMDIPASTNRIMKSTILNKIPRIPMELILSDSDKLFTKKNTHNVTGYNDVDCYLIGPNSDRKTNKMYMGIVYLLRPNATKKLLPVEQFYNNLLEYYKMSQTDRSNHIEKISKDFYKDDCIDPEAEKINYENSWDDDEQKELWKWQKDKLKNMKNMFNF